MRALRQFGVLFLLLVTFAAPVMACMVPNAEMSAQERACCMQMKAQCGQMEMPASHGCCHKTLTGIRDSALDNKTITFHPVVVTGVWLAAYEWVNSTPAVAEWIESPEYSPPQSPPSTISILRI